MNMIKIGLIGSNGKMGQAIIEAIHFFTTLNILKYITSHDQLNEIDNSVNIWIDFSSIKYALIHAKQCAQYNIPLIIGTTGDIDFNLLKEYSAHIPIMYVPNASIIFAHIRHLLTKLNTWEVAIGDTHHNTKKDSPSGTTKDILGFMQNVKSIYSFRNNINGAKMHFDLAQDDEMLSLTYTTCNRTPYAKGALILASWLITQGKGLYNMTDYINSQKL